LKIYLKYANSLIVSAVVMVTLADGLFAQDRGTVTDKDGNTYNTIKIGNLIWMTENLKTTRFNDGTPISVVTDKTKWSQLSTPACCWYNNDTTFKKKYGVLYNGYALFTGKLCPSGWHVSTDSDWSDLINNSGGQNIAGGRLKDAGTAQWESPNTGATNETGFSALPGGSRFKNGMFITINRLGYWWSPKENNTYSCWYRGIYHKDNYVSRNFTDSSSGFSVRCVKD
jgi:uncharacterized protein (TIGR02145 family)